MPSPFPGVDPYIECQGLWPDFHSKFINALQESLLTALPDSYDARMDERVYILDAADDDGGPGKLILPDVAVEHDESRWTPSQSTHDEGAVATLDTDTVTIPLANVFEVREVFIRIVEREDRSLVAVLEVLSPTNKTSGRHTYLLKRQEIIGTSVHLVELDLLFSGRRLPMDLPLPPGDYYALVSDGRRRPDSEVSAWMVDHPLPKISIPLGPDDPPVRIDLAAVFNTAWERGGYQRAINYNRPFDLPVGDARRDWIEWQAQAGG